MTCRFVLAVCAAVMCCQGQQANLVMESAEELGRIQFNLSRQLEADGIDLTDRSMLVEKLRALKGPTAAWSALALSFLPPDRLTVNELEVAVTQGDDVVSLGSARALSRMGEKAWADRGAERLGRFQFHPARINFGMYMARAGKYDGWPNVEAALRDPKSGGAEFSSALAATDAYIKMRGTADAASLLASSLSEILGEAEKAAAPASRLEQLRLKIQYLQSIKKP